MLATLMQMEIVKQRYGYRSAPLRGSFSMGGIHDGLGMCWFYLWENLKSCIVAREKSR
jgi:hypothetical protein